MVTSTADDGSAGTLRSALNQANSATGAQTIEFSPLFNTPQTITLSGQFGTLALKNQSGITITGPEAGLTINGGGNGGSGRAFSVYLNDTASISGVTITGGTGNFGGALYNHGGTLNLTNCTVAGNTASKYGGGLYTSGGTVNLTNCTFFNNSAGSGFYGGAIYNLGADVSLVNCTISGNTAAFGGGLYDAKETFVYSNTSLQGTIVAGNTATDAHGGPNLWGNIEQTEFISAGHNLIGANPDGAIVTLSATDLLNKDPLLAPLGNYGGPTQTMPLRPGSPAIGKGFAVLGLTDHDQRGFPVDNPPDIGAFQVQAGPETVNTVSDGITSQPGQMSMRQAVNLANVLNTATTITFDQSAGGAFATLQAITLDLGQLELSDTGGAQTITGPTTGVTVNGDGQSRVIQIDGGVTASFSGLLISGGGGTADRGAGLLNLGSANLTLNHCTLTGNTASSNGGGLANYGTATLNNCTITDNTAQGNGGGLDSYDSAGGGTVTLTNCAVSANTAKGIGGGLFLKGPAIKLTGCTISGNTANQNAGGVWSYPTTKAGERGRRGDLERLRHQRQQGEHVRWRLRELYG